MNIERVNKIVMEILQVEDDLNLQGNISNLVTYFQQNNPTELNNNRNLIIKGLTKSVINTYVNSDLKILKSLAALGYFDLTLIESINQILSGESHEVLTKLTELRDRRAALIDKFRKLRSSFTELGIRGYEIDKSLYEIVLSLPEKYHNLSALDKAIGDIDKFLKALSFSIKDSEYKIKSVDNGCIELIIQTIPELAKNILDVIETILTIKGAIDLVKEAKDMLKDYSKANKKTIEESHDVQLEETKKKEIEILVGKISNKEWNEEARTSVTIQFKKIVTYFEEGVTIEVKVPFLPEPEVYNGDDKEGKEEYKLMLNQYKKFSEIIATNKKIMQIQIDEFKLNLPQEQGESNSA